MCTCALGLEAVYIGLLKVVLQLHPNKVSVSEFIMQCFNLEEHGLVIRNYELHVSVPSDSGTLHSPSPSSYGSTVYIYME